MYIKEYRKVKWYKRILNKIQNRPKHNIKWVFKKVEN